MTAPTVVSVGSLNLDRTVKLDAGEAESLAARYEWFPASGATRTVESVPDAVDEMVDETSVGGKGANQAVAAARAGADAALVGAVGPDGEEALDTLAARSVDVSDVERVEERTGTAYVFVEPDGQNRIAVVEGANGAVDPFDSFERIRGADAVLLQNEIPLPTADRLLDRLDDTASPPVILDPAPPAGAERLLSHPAVSVVTPNEDEYRALRPALPDYPGRTVVTREEKDVWILDGDRESVPVPPADPVDTTGAGDAFAGYLAAAFGSGASLRSAVASAAHASARTTESAGTQRAIPARTKL